MIILIHVHVCHWCEDFNLVHQIWKCEVHIFANFETRQLKPPQSKISSSHLYYHIRNYTFMINSDISVHKCKYDMLQWTMQRLICEWIKKHIKWYLLNELWNHYFHITVAFVKIFNVSIEVFAVLLDNDMENDIKINKHLINKQASLKSDRKNENFSVSCLEMLNHTYSSLENVPYLLRHVDKIINVFNMPVHSLERIVLFI